MARYCNPAMRQLVDQQVRYAPRDVRIGQIERAESLIGELDPDKEYPYHELCQKVTSYRPEMYPDLVLSGEDAVHDLRRFVEDLSDSADIPVESIEEPVYTVQDLSERYNVSTKTVDRWRDRGLVSRKLLFGKRKRVSFLESSVERFVENHSGEIDRGRRFSQLSEREREDIIRRARRLARFGGCPAEVSRRLARKTGRSQETIRYTLKNYDAEHPESAVFPSVGGQLDDVKKREIYRSFRRGTPVERLAKRYCRTKTSIYRIVSEIRAGRLIEQPIDYMYAEEFDVPGREEVILGPPPENPNQKKTTAKAPPGLPPYLASLYSIPLLTREDEEYYFRKMNYLLHRAAQLRESIGDSRPKSSTIDEIENYIERSLEVKNFLIRSNLRLVVSIAKRHIKPNTNFFEMVSDGNMSLIRAIEKFDYTKGNKFSTYASWAIMKNFARTIPAEHTRLDRFRTGNDEVFMRSSDERGSQFEEERINKSQREIIMGILDQLEDRERNIIVSRFGLKQGSEPLTLEQVGGQFGVTKERIRQIESRALGKLRRIAHERKLDIPGL